MSCLLANFCAHVATISLRPIPPSTFATPSVPSHPVHEQAPSLVAKSLYDSLPSRSDVPVTTLLPLPGHRTCIAVMGTLSTMYLSPHPSRALPLTPIRIIPSMFHAISHAPRTPTIVHSPLHGRFRPSALDTVGISLDKSFVIELKLFRWKAPPHSIGFFTTHLRKG
jgi:hypothetical protein